MAMMRTRRKLVLASVLTLAALAALLAPSTAFAGPLDFITGLSDFDPAGDLVASSTSYINGVTINGLTDSFTNLLGDSFTTVKRVFGKVSQGFGYSVLIIVYLVQLVKIATHMESNAQLPGLKETLTLLIFFVIFKHLVDCSLDYIGYIYDEFNRLTIWIGNGGNLSVTPAGEITVTGNIVTEEQMRGLLNEDDGFLVRLIEALIVFIAALVLKFAAFFSVLARSLQAYVLAIFSPIPVAFLGLDDTRSWGLGYLKNFLAICMAGALIMVVVLITPHVLSAAAQSGLLAVVAACFVCVFAMFKAGSWAKDILGG
ncbi:MAG: type IV secretion system protein [Eggerthellaceae bacterium]|nr:type IV secretion system protein [Eggerthellaceae bacterium]